MAMQSDRGSPSVNGGLAMATMASLAVLVAPLTGKRGSVEKGGAEKGDVGKGSAEKGGATADRLPLQPAF